MDALSAGFNYISNTFLAPSHPPSPVQLCNRHCHFERIKNFVLFSSVLLVDFWESRVALYSNMLFISMGLYFTRTGRLALVLTPSATNSRQTSCFNVMGTEEGKPHSMYIPRTSASFVEITALNINLIVCKDPCTAMYWRSKIYCFTGKDKLANLCVQK